MIRLVGCLLFSVGEMEMITNEGLNNVLERGRIENCISPPMGKEKNLLFAAIHALSSLSQL